MTFFKHLLCLIAVVNLTLVNSEKYTTYPREVKLYEDDTYYCRTSLGMSYYMLRGTSMQGKFYWSDEEHKFYLDPMLLSRPYYWYTKRPRELRRTYCDRVFAEILTEHVYREYRSYVEVSFEHLTVVDGFTVEGGLPGIEESDDDDDWMYVDDENEWILAPTRYTVNYTVDGNTWIPFRNKMGDILQFTLMEIFRPDSGTSTAAYTKFDPRIVARALRLVFAAKRERFDYYFCLVMELYGCQYEPENYGLQTGFRKRSDMLFGRRNLYPWQLLGYKDAKKPEMSYPIYDAAMSLSRFYVDDEIGTMMDGMGYCVNASYNEFIVYLAQEGTFQFKNAPFGAVYRIANLKQHRDCTLDNLNNKNPWIAATCLGYESRFKNYMMHYKQHKGRKAVPQKYFKYSVDHRMMLRITINRNQAKKKPCYQQIRDSKFTFTPPKIKRSKGCNSLLRPYGTTYCRSGKKYLAIDLKKISILDRISFQGHRNKLRRSWVTTLTVHYSTDNVIWLPLKGRYAPNAILNANSNQYRAVSLYLNPRLRARYLRIAPLRGRNGLCLRVEIRGCTKEPWLSEIQKVKRDAEKIGFGLWYIRIGTWNEDRYLPIDCFRGKTEQLKKFGGTVQIYEVVNGVDFVWEKKKVFFPKGYKSVEARFFKCVARDRQGDIVSTQLYIITFYGETRLLLPLQELDLMRNGGVPVLDYPGTVWTYEPFIGKLTFIYFPGTKFYRFTLFGQFDENDLDFFAFTLLGTARSWDACFNLAVFNYHEYFVWDNEAAQCLSSWYLPLAAKSERAVKFWTKPGRRVAEKYKIYQIHTFRYGYKVLWKKDWLLGSYEIKPIHDNQVYFTQPNGVGRYRFHFNSYLSRHGYESHTLVIRNFVHEDVTSYSINIVEKRNGNSYNRAVHLRHFGQPRLNMSLSTGACVNYPLTITATPIRTEYQDPKEWDVEWKKIANGKAVATKMETSDPFQLKVSKTALKHSGRYQIRARNRYGFVEAFTDITIADKLPTISSVTPSPHTAIEDTSDILQVTVKNAQHADFQSVDWYFKGKLITVTDKQYSFPGSVAGKPWTRKILKLNNMHPGMSGVYRVTTKAKYCQFYKEIKVEVYVRPKMIVSPAVQTIYQIAGGNTTKIKVVVAGGMPEPQADNLFWYKDSKLLQSTRHDRISIKNTQWLDTKEGSKTIGKIIGWNSTLSIGSPRVSDSGIYSFMISFPKSNYTVERTFKVTKIT